MQTARTCRPLEVKVLEEGFFPRLSALWAGSAAEMGHRRRGRFLRDLTVAGCSLNDLTNADRQNMSAFGSKGAGRRFLPSPECTVGRIGGRDGSPSTGAIPARPCSCGLQPQRPHTNADRQNMPAFGSKGAGRRFLPSPECTVGRIGGRDGSPSTGAIACLDQLFAFRGV
jgi:hypothetical protein